MSSRLDLIIDAFSYNLQLSTSVLCAKWYLKMHFAYNHDSSQGY